ncbi:MAG: hypothetical protein WD601_11360 [Pseudohongiellaceae bacterium]
MDQSTRLKADSKLRDSSHEQQLLMAWLNRRCRQTADEVPGQVNFPELYPILDLDAVLLGRRLFNRVLAAKGVRFVDISVKNLNRLLAADNARSLDKVFEDIGDGRLMACAVVRSLLSARAC